MKMVEWAVVAYSLKDKLIKKILQKIYVGWVVITFITTMMLAFIFLLMSKLMPRLTALKYSNTVLKSWAWFWGILVGLRYKREGWKPEYGQRAMVMITNHNSYLDTPLSYVNIKAAFRTLAKRELIKLPVMGFIFQTSGIMVDRSSPESRKESYDRMLNALEIGESLLIYPEGTQNRTEEPMQKFYDGAFRAAIDKQVPILPILSINSRRIMPQAKFGRMVPGKMTQIFLPPIETKGMTMDDVAALSDRVRDQLVELQAKRDPKYPK